MLAYRDSDAEKIQDRQWGDIRKEWMNYVPDHNSPWPVPEHEVYELPTVESLLGNLGGPEKRDTTFEDEIVGLRVSALHESVIHVHKAANVLRAAATEGTHGFRTWSRSSAYHAAFFGMRAVLGLLGVLVFRGRDRRIDFQVDLWAPRLKKKKPEPTESRYAVRIIRRSKLAEHKALWGIFSRVLRVAKIDPQVWPLLRQDPLRHFDPGDFSIVRHEIHYQSNSWLFDDLNDLTNKDDFSNLATEVTGMKQLSKPNDRDFPLALALHNLSLSAALLDDLGKIIPNIDEEAKRLQGWMKQAPWKCANAFSLLGARGTI